MASVMIKCPRTERYVSTGVDMDPQSFADSLFEANRVTCPHCGETHTWGTREARLVVHHQPLGKLLKE